MCCYYVYNNKNSDYITVHLRFKIKNQNGKQQCSANGALQSELIGPGDGPSSIPSPGMAANAIKRLAGDPYCFPLNITELFYI